METSRTIEIDFDVHKKIEMERQCFSETPNDVLKRILKIENKKISSKSNGASWSGKGVTLPHSTLLQAEYNGKIYEGTIDNGRWFVHGQYFTSPSGAIINIAKTKDGSKTSLNGWSIWLVKRPHDTTWYKLSNLRN